MDNPFEQMEHFEGWTRRKVSKVVRAAEVRPRVWSVYTCHMVLLFCETLIVSCLGF